MKGLGYQYDLFTEKYYFCSVHRIVGIKPREVIAKRGISPTIICESAGTQSYDAKILKDEYEKAKNN